ncbi:3-keto-5-aminohexanoate cleavage protein [bacterium]|nr:3-keto-5-aminohexanoate cleavage protein [bacterium]
MEKLIITAAITGSKINRDSTPHIPIKPEEIVQSSIECWEAGASVVHIHVRDPQTGLGTQNIEIFRQVVEPLRQQTDLILCLTTSGIPGRNLPTADRLSVLELQPELASFDAGSINLGAGVFSNSPEFLQEAASKMKEKGVKPELEIFDLGMIMTCLNLKERGFLVEPFHFQLVLGTPWGAPASLKSLVYLHEHIPENSTWSAFGIGKNHLPIAMAAMISGGHVRVGMEDCIYLEKGILAKSNAQFVERIVRLASEYGREIASPTEARKILNLD